MRPQVIVIVVLVWLCQACSQKVVRINLCASSAINLSDNQQAMPVQLKFLGLRSEDDSNPERNPSTMIAVPSSRKHIELAFPTRPEFIAVEADFHQNEPSIRRLLIPLRYPYWQRIREHNVYVFKNSLSYGRPRGWHD